MILDKLASSIFNDIVSGLRGYHSNLSLSLDQLKSDIIDMRLQIIKEYQLKGILPLKDLMISINCIPVNCKAIEKCTSCSKYKGGTPTLHFEIPLLLNDFGSSSIFYIGSVDKQNPFIVYTNPQAFKYNLYRKRGKNKPFVFVDTTPNENGMYDCFLFNAPFVKQVSITAIFKDPSLLENYSCCDENSDDNYSFINNEIKNRLVRQKIQYYRSFLAPLKPNDQAQTTA